MANKEKYSISAMCRLLNIPRSHIYYKKPRRKIREIMNKYKLISNYTVKQYKVHKSKCNEDKVGNIVNREFGDREDLEIVVSDLTYVNVMGRWHYICLVINLFNREIVGYSADAKKDAKLVYEAFFTSM